jgi:ADP-ribosylglycohydrolase
MKRNLEHFRGCLLGGAIGDALGYPIEFMSTREIQDLIPSTSGKAVISDDTQMTLFTAEGLLRAETMWKEQGKINLPGTIFYAYERWLLTQGYPRWESQEQAYDGWLLFVPELNVSRAPGNSCISSLLSRIQGTTHKPINNSKGCGGVMRVAPIGLVCEVMNAFELGMDSAALTHGHPSGYLSAGALSYLIALLIEEGEMYQAVEATLEKLATFDNHQECSQKLREARDLSTQPMEPLKAIQILGEGWVGEEALAISVYCALKYPFDFKKAVVTAVNHPGDSDSTGAITGNIMGANLGITSIPENWINGVELSDVILQVADDLLVVYEDSDVWREKYPGR